MNSFSFTLTAIPATVTDGTTAFLTAITSSSCTVSAKFISGVKSSAQRPTSRAVYCRLPRQERFGFGLEPTELAEECGTEAPGTLVGEDKRRVDGVSDADTDTVFSVTNEMLYQT